MRLFRIAVIAGTFVAVGPGSSHADNGATNADATCRRGPTPEIRIKACTTILSAKDVPAEKLARAHRLRAAAHALVRNEKQAIVDYTQAIRLKPDYGLAYVGRGNTFLAQRKIDAATDDYTRAIELLPRYGPAHVARGYARMTQGKLDEAIADFKAAIAIAPRSATAYNNLGLAQRKKSLPSMAIESYDQAIRFNPLYALAYLNRGYAYEATGRIENAISDFRTAIFLDPSLSGARARLKHLGVKDGFVKDSDVLVKSGRTLATENCARCHAIGRKGQSKHLRAPPFRVVQNRHPVLALRVPLERTIAYPHDDMPKFQLTDAQIDAIVAYINSLQISK